MTLAIQRGSFFIAEDAGPRHTFSTTPPRHRARRRRSVATQTFQPWHAFFFHRDSRGIARRRSLSEQKDLRAFCRTNPHDRIYLDTRAGANSLLPLPSL